MKQGHQTLGKISDHFEGVGTVTRDMVVQRARELAMINGRAPNHYSTEDYLQAKRELTGDDENGNPQAEEEPIAGLTSWDEEPGTSGHASHLNDIADEQTLSQQLVEQGVNEAEHEQMVEGARNSRGQR
jgi:hypothetical protein